VHGEPVIRETEAERPRAAIPSASSGCAEPIETLAIAWRDSFAGTVGGEVRGGANVVGMAGGVYLIDC